MKDESLCPYPQLVAQLIEHQTHNPTVMALPDEANIFRHGIT